MFPVFHRSEFQKKKKFGFFPTNPKPFSSVQDLLLPFSMPSFLSLSSVKPAPSVAPMKRQWEPTHFLMRHFRLQM